MGGGKSASRSRIRIARTRARMTTDAKNRSHILPALDSRLSLLFKVAAGEVVGIGSSVSFSVEAPSSSSGSA